MSYDILHCYTGAVLYHAADATGLRAAVIAAVRSGANLSGANLSGANLSDANLSDANLSGANLSGANLSDANLSDANLSGAYLSDANLSDANLRGANLRGAYLSDANLSGANLSDANLRGANLSGAYLSDANLRGANLRGAYLSGSWDAEEAAEARKDLRSVLDVAPSEVPGLLAAVREGRVDGSVYSGKCACLLGTIAIVRGCDYRALGIAPNADRPAEQWFMRIRPGHTPAISPAAKLVEEWILEWQVEHAAKPEVQS